MTDTPKLAAVAGLGAMLCLAAPAFAANEQAFQARTTAELVRLCSTPPSDPSYGQSLQFCHGFAAGALSYHRATRRPGATPDYCGLPASRQAAVDRFVAWAQANPQYDNENPANTLFRFLDANFACR